MQHEFKDPKEWLEEYYPTPAKENAGDDLTAAKHSLKKWEGTAVFSDFGMWKARWSHILDVDGNEVIDFGPETCALCARYWVDKCEGCPVVKLTGWSCWVDDRTFRNPWGAWVVDEDPKPMIDMLTRVVEELTEERMNQPKTPAHLILKGDPE